MKFRETVFEVRATNTNRTNDSFVAAWVHYHLDVFEDKDFASKEEMHKFFTKNEDDLIDKACKSAEDFSKCSCQGLNLHFMYE